MTYALKNPIVSESLFPQECVEGVIERVTFHAEDTGYTVARLRPGDRNRSSPVVVGAADLGNARVVAQLKASYAAGQTVAMTDATPQQAARLSNLLLTMLQRVDSDGSRREARGEEAEQ